MEKQLIPAGYKQTEAGLIPLDWHDTVIGNVAEFVGGSQPPKSTFKSIESLGYIRLIQIRDYKKDTYITYIPEHLAQKKCNSDDIMIGRYGPPIFQILRGIQGAYNVALIKAIPNEKIVREFLFYTLKSEKLFQVMEILSQRSSGQTGVDLPALKSYLLALPSKEEQTAIANALSDVDALIAALEKLINKKSAIKTAAMQQLLTGKKRLPPFDQLNTGYKQTELGEIPGDWEVGNLPQYVWYQEGPGLRNWQFTTKGMKVINVTNLQYSGFLDLDKTDRHISIELYEKMYRHFECDAGDFVMASSGNSYSKSSVVRECDLPLLMNTSVIRFKAKENIASSYMQSYLKSKFFKDQIDLMITGGAQPNFGPYHLNRIFLPIPSSLEEQTAIATVLSDMDKDLEALQKRLHKTQQIKQGMMQELLTGKTRLVEPQGEPSA